MQAACRRISQGEYVAKAAEAEGVTRQTLWNWTEADPALLDLYTRAREESAAALEEEALEAAREALDGRNGNVNAARLRVDTLKWAAAKRRPKVYGDKAQVEVTGKDSGPLTVHVTRDP